ncbi:MAG: Gfo/Idh/MocA family protein [Kiloniellaceae bacterium]
MRIAVVGCGQIADAHISEAQKIAGVEVAAVMDLNVHMAEQAAVRYGVPRAYTDPTVMLQEVKPDVVHITTPPASHLPLGTLAIEHGAHVYVEKPFAVDAREARELVAIAERHGRLVCVGHNMTFDSPFLRLREAYRSGELGDIVHVEGLMGYNLAGPFGAVSMGDPTHWVHRLPGGIAQNNISHPLSMILEFLHDEAPRVVAAGQRCRKERYGDVRDRVLDEVRATLIGKSATGNLVFTCHARPVQLYVQVHGTKRQAICHFDARTLRYVDGGTMPGPFRRIQWAYDDLKQARREHRRLVRRFLAGKMHFFEGMSELFRRFYDAVAGRAEMPIPMSEAVRITAVMDEIFRQCNETLSEDRDQRSGKRTAAAGGGRAR